MSPLEDLSHALDRRAVVRRIELLKTPHGWLCRAIDRDGDVGIAAAAARMPLVWPIFAGHVAPFAVGRDARKLGEFVDEVERFKSSYKLGLAFRVCVAAAEGAMIDLVGRKCGRNVADLAGGRRRDDVDVYLSHTGRGTMPEQEVDLFRGRLAATGCRAIKYKVGGRMSRNADQWPGRSEAVTKALADAFPAVERWADANGSYDDRRAVEVGRMLAGHGVAVFEEPCPFDEYEQTKAVADALDLTVAGGEQDTSFARFRWQVENRAVDLLQPDVNYNGGLVRFLRVAALADAHGIPVAPHSPHAGPEGAILLHAASLAPRTAAFHEWTVWPPGDAGWHAPSLAIDGGRVAVPAGPGLGIEFDPAVLAAAEVVTSAGD